MKKNKRNIFSINNSIWTIKEYNAEILKKEYDTQNGEESYYVFGVTKYPEHEIWLNKDMCMDQRIKTLKHELTHCYIWNYGLYNVPHFSEEMVCDLVSCINDFINGVVTTYLRGAKEN